MKTLQKAEMLKRDQVPLSLSMRAAVSDAYFLHSLHTSEQNAMSWRNPTPPGWSNSTIPSRIAPTCTSSWNSFPVEIS